MTFSKSVRASGSTHHSDFISERLPLSNVHALHPETFNLSHRHPHLVPDVRCAFH